MNKVTIAILSVVALLGTSDSRIASAQEAKRPFTVADDIGLTYFYDLGGGRAEVLFSPDESYFAVWSERGRVELNCVEDSLRIYRRQDVEAFLRHADTSHPVTPVWIEPLWRGGTHHPRLALATRLQRSGFLAG